MTVPQPIRHFLLRSYPIIVLLVLYEMMTRFGLVSQRLLPSLVLIARQLWRGLENGDLVHHTSVTLYRTGFGFSLALVGGVVIGFAMAQSRLAEKLIDPIFTFGYPIPKIALYPAIVLLLGLGSRSTIALVFLECIYPIAIHVHAGVRSVNRSLVWAARSMGASRARIFARVLVPASLPFLFTGLRIALPLALIVTIVTEIIGESEGLGYYITFSSASFEYARALAAFVVVGVVGFCLDRALIYAGGRIVFWQKSISIME
jgi:NitT/TauT family transport system permease protein